MKVIDPIFAYISILAVIQPARIQDIEVSAKSILPNAVANGLLERNKLRDAHEHSRNAGLVVPVRRGVYFLTAKGRAIVRRAGLEKGIDNSRLFLMKRQRREYR